MNTIILEYADAEHEYRACRLVNALDALCTFTAIATQAASLPAEQLHGLASLIADEARQILPSE